jgi:hypothetical protein
MSKRDYLLIAHPATQALGAFKAHFTKTVAAARSQFPQLEWRAGFTLGPRDCVEVFSAESSQEAVKVSRFVGEIGGLRAEVVPLRSGW